MTNRRKKIIIDPLPGDSWDYELVYEGVKASKDIEGLCLEIGLRRGGGSKHIINSIADNCPGKVAVSIDPYGSILTECKDGNFVRLDYDESMKADCMSNIYRYAHNKGVQFIFINLEDTEFFQRYSDGIPIYNIEKQIVNKYAFVFFDGPHAFHVVKEEVDFFLDRISKGSCFCFDDISTTDYYYNHDAIEKYLLEKGFTILRKTDKKGLYQYEG